MKKLINDPFKVATESIEGHVKAYSHIVKQVSPHVIARKNAPVNGKVGVVIGGGSGHEPLFLGFVGYGMADSAALGEIFAAPAAPRIMKATKASNGGRGILYVHGNYAGDNMNFGLAAEMATDEGIDNATVRVWDDVSSAPPERLNERRGLAGDLFVIKIAGSMAETFAPLPEVSRAAEKARDNCRTFAVALSPSTIPATGQPTFTIGDDEMYFGIGGHGERGINKTKMLTADETAIMLVDKIIDDLPFKKNNEVNIIVNGYGSTTLMELNIINRKVHQLISDREIGIHRTEIGNFCTTQEMAGCSITLIKLDDELKRLYDAPCYTPTLKKSPVLVAKLA